MHSPRHWAARLAIARGFAAYIQTIDPATEVPPPGVFPARRHRPTPYLWSQEEICRLLEGARALRSPLRAATHEALTHYAARRDRLCPRPRFTAFFLSGTGTRLERSGVEKTLRKITPPWASERRRSARGHMTSGTALLWPP